MNYNKWLAKAEKKVAKMSPKMKLVMLAALVDDVESEISDEGFLFSHVLDYLVEYADFYAIDLVFDEDSEDNTAGDYNENIVITA